LPIYGIIIPFNNLSSIASVKKSLYIEGIFSDVFAYLLASDQSPAILSEPIIEKTDHPVNLNSG
jgi:hypothetical protein